MDKRLDDLSDEIRNATTCLKGVIKKTIKYKMATKKDIVEMYFQINRIEKSLSTYVQQMNEDDG